MRVSKKMVGSLAIVVVTLALAIGGTISYFSDTETSTDNTFVAGAIDLRVDSFAHYNGLICLDGQWNECEEPDLNSNLVVNGSFEDPEVTNAAKWEVFSSIPGWSIDWVNDGVTSYGGTDRPEPALQEYHEGVNGWLAADGNQYAELDADWGGPSSPVSGEPALVEISQDVPTKVGMKYVLKYAFSPRPSTGAADNELHVYIGGSLVDTNAAAGGAQTQWTEYTKYFTASGSTTEIKFEGDGTDNSLGVFLDNIRVYPMLCTPSEEYTESCSSTWNLTDLGPEHQFFNFGDIKPGDWGENTVSLHVNSNDAYACMLFSGLEDLENEINDPESEVDDNETGELSQNVKMFAWKDDGDNIWEKDETPLWDNPIPASQVNGTLYPLATPQTEAIVGGDIRYVGIAWCAGTMDVNGESYEIKCDGEGMGNDTQTDQMRFDVSFYVEQARHNEEFNCSKLLRVENVEN